MPRPPLFNYCYYCNKPLVLLLVCLVLMPAAELAAQLAIPTNYEMLVSCKKQVQSQYVFDQIDELKQIDYNDLQSWSEVTLQDKYYLCDLVTPHVLTTVVGQTGLTPDYLSGNYVFWQDSLGLSVYDHNYNLVEYQEYSEGYREVYNNESKFRFFHFGIPSVERLASISGDGLSYSFDSNGILEVTTSRQTFIYDKERLRIVEILRDSTGQQTYKVIKKYKRLIEIDPSYTGNPSDVVPTFIREEKPTNTVTGLCATQIRTTTYEDYRIVQHNCQQLSNRSVHADLLITPNPVPESLIVKLPGEFLCDISITSVTGQVLITRSQLAGEAKLDVDHLQSGTYILKAQAADGSNLTSKFIKL